MSTTANNDSSASDPKVQLQEYIDLAQRAYALQKFEEAVENYASALEIFTAEHGQNSPESADLLFKYGKALLENAIAQASVLGKEPPAEEAAPDAEAGEKIHFSGDAEEEDEEEDEDDEDSRDVIMEGQEAVKLGDVGRIAEEDEEDEEMADAEPEDDFNAAWEVLDLARALYAKADGDDAKFKLAETYIALGDVSLETEKFDQAMTDYSSALELKSTLLPLSSRQIAEVHYKLSIVSDLSLGKLANAIDHAEKACKSLDGRLTLLKKAMESGDAPRDLPASNGKGKETFEAQEQAKINTMTHDEIKSEIKEIEGLREELLLKIEDLKTSPETRESAPDAANRALDEALGKMVAEAKNLPVNDLTGMVKKKKAVQPAESSTANGAEAPVANGTS